MVVLKFLFVFLAFYGVWRLCGLVVIAPSKGTKLILALFTLAISVILGQFLRNGVF